MAFSNMKLRDFINYVVTLDNIDSVLSKCTNDSEKGFIFERMTDVVIKFGFCDLFKNSEYHHMIGNVNRCKIKELENYNDYLNSKVISGNSSGCSDITLKNKTDGTYIFITSKYECSQNKEKSIDDYDVQNILAVILNNKDIYKKYKIYIVVNDKQNVLNKAINSNKSSDYITKHITKDNVIDKYDINKYFLMFKQSILKNSSEKWDDIYLSPKTKLELRFHQELITKKTSMLIEEGNKSFLWGCKCRSGKTYMIGGIILKQFDIKNTLNVLIITPAPTETIPQFTDDLFKKYKDFDTFKVHQIESSKDIKNITIEQNNIFVMSKQLLQKYINEKTIINIKNLNLDIIGFDENHFSGTTDLSKDILTSYSSKNTVKIYLTATYNKPLKEWNISDECQMFWDIEDEQICKSILVNSDNISKLKDKHGKEYIDTVIKQYTDCGYNNNDIFSSYLKMPELHLITNLFDQQRYNIIKEKIMGSYYGFSFDVLFSLNKHNTFNYKTEIETILRYISGSEKETDFKNGDKSIFSRIKNIQTRSPFVQIWFLPSENINTISTNLKELMNEDSILKKYNIMCVNSKNTELVMNIKDEIMGEIKKARNEKKHGLIILAGNMLSLGITIRECDVVMMMNNTLSSDKIMQQMYRCMSEDDNKKVGIVVDLNISRVLHTCVNYTIHKNDTNIEDKIKYIIENHLINIDADMMMTKNIDCDTIVKKLLNIWKSDPINNFKTLLRNIENDCIMFDNPTQKIINESFTRSVGDKINYTVQLNDDFQEIQTGKEIKKEKIKTETQEDNKDDNNDEEEVDDIEQISFSKDVLPYIIPLVCILTMESKNKDFAHMLNDIKNSKELLEIFDDQCFIWWNHKGLIEVIYDIVNKYFDKKSDTYNVSIKFKLSIQSLLDRPKELLELISECLKPKKIEKKTFGEVFTPMNFINDKMLADIETYWMSKTNENIWTNDKLTWYDPAAGMGNYPIAIYYKLLEGLTDKYPNENIRKKHIIENMLFMGELNKKNCFIMKQIFNINNDYNLNLYEGDTLQIDTIKTFNKNAFDIIIGNPPYNEELTKVGAKPLYNKFIEYYVDKCNILSYIVPSRWFAGGKGLDKFRDMMLNRTDIVYINHFDDASKIFGNAVSIPGGVNYFLIDNQHNGLCKYNNNMVKLSEHDIIIDSKYSNFINKMSKHENITKYYVSQDHYKIQTNDQRLKDNLDVNHIKCFVSQQKGFIKFIDRSEIKNAISKYKVITARANGTNGCFGNMFIGCPDEVHTKSYISFNLNTEDEAKSLLSYMKCRLPNFMLHLRKISQDISKETCKWIPLVPLDREWTNDSVYKYLELTHDEIQMIKETKICGYGDICEKNNGTLTNINAPKIIKDGRKQYYLIDDNLYKVKKDKSCGVLFGKYINETIIENTKNKK